MPNSRDQNQLVVASNTVDKPRAVVITQSSECTISLLEGGDYFIDDSGDIWVTEKKTPANADSVRATCFLTTTLDPSRIGETQTFSASKPVQPIAFPYEVKIVYVSKQKKL